MAAHLIMRISITDAERWERYREAVVPLIATFGGAHVTQRGGAERLEGEDDGRRLVVFTFPSMEAIHAFWSSPAYVPVKELRRGAAELEAWAVPGLGYEE